MEENERPQDIVDSILYIWLDASINSRHESKTTVTKIQKIVKDRLQTFTDPDECVDFITNDDNTQKIYLIVSNKFGVNVVPLIYSLPKIEAIYVYCGDKKAAEQWVTPDRKVRKIFIREKLLLRQIFADVRGPTNDDGISMTVFQLQEQGNSLQKLSPEGAKFMWYQLAMSVLLLMAKHFDSRNEMIIEARAHYPEDAVEKQKIDKFEAEYQPAQACWWYSLNSFVYRLLNRALRTQDIDIIFKFRFFINDLHNQIQQLYREYLVNHTGNSLTVYRGQFMSMDEIEFLKNNINQLVSMNTFLSTSKDCDVAEMFLDLFSQSNDSRSLQSVLFTIYISDINEDTTPFAFIAQYACNPEENEILFTINAIFKVKSVEKQGNIWHIHLQLSKRQNEQQKDFLKYMTKAVGSDPSPISFGWFLYRMNEFQKAERYAVYMTNQEFLDEQDKADAYNLLGLIFNDLGKFTEAVQHYEKAIEIYDNSVRVSSPQIIAIHYNISLAYLACGDNRLAEDHRKVFDRLLTGSSVASGSTLMGMRNKLAGKFAHAHGNYDEALRSLKAALEHKKKERPTNPPSIAHTLHEIGVIYAEMNNDTEALNHFKEAIDIGEKNLSDDHFDLAEYHAAIGRIHYKNEKYDLGLQKFQTALKIITNATREDHPVLTELLEYIKACTDKLYPPIVDE